MAYSNSLLSPYGIFPIAQENKYWGNFSYFIMIVCCVYSLELPHWGSSSEYTQQIIILLKIENISINYRHLLPDLAPWLNLIASNYPSIEQISMVPKIFEPLKFNCVYIFLFSMKTYVVGEALLMSIFSKCFHQEMRKLFTWYTLVSRPMIAYTSLGDSFGCMSDCWSGSLGFDRVIMKYFLWLFSPFGCMINPCPAE